MTTVTRVLLNDLQNNLIFLDFLSKGKRFFNLLPKIMIYSGTFMQLSTTSMLGRHHFSLCVRCGNDSYPSTYNILQSNSKRGILLLDKHISKVLLLTKVCFCFKDMFVHVCDVYVYISHINFLNIFSDTHHRLVIALHLTV